MRQRRREITIDQAIRRLEATGPIPDEVKRYLTARKNAEKQVFRFQEKLLVNKVKNAEDALDRLANGDFVYKFVGGRKVKIRTGSPGRESNGNWKNKRDQEQFARIIRKAGLDVRTINTMRSRRGIGPRQGVKVPY